MALVHPHEILPARFEPVDAELGLAGRIVGTRYTAPAAWRDDDASIQAWLSDGEVIQEIEKRVGFWLGDWARQGLAIFGQGKWSQAMREHGYALQTIKNASSTAKMFPPADRVYEKLSYSHYVTAKDLPSDEAHEMLAAIAERPPSVADFREMVSDRKTELRLASLKELPTPRLSIDDMTLLVGDALALSLPDASVDGIVTSPPYALEKRYDQGGDESSLTWFGFTKAWMAEAYRVAKPGGRLMVNVPIDTTVGGHRPTAAQATSAAMMAGWHYNTTIIWIDDQLGKSTARGSMDSASAPNVIAPAEVVLVFYKGDEFRIPQDTKPPSDLTRESWVEWCHGIWRFPGESNPWEYHPAAFPLELPRRLLHLFTFPEDVILDLFLGSGTTALACLKWNRKFIGVDKSPFYVASTGRRLQQAVA